MNILKQKLAPAFLVTTFLLFFIPASTKKLLHGFLQGEIDKETTP